MVNRRVYTKFDDPRLCRSRDPDRNAHRVDIYRLYKRYHLSTLKSLLCIPIQFTLVLKAYLKDNLFNKFTCMPNLMTITIIIPGIYIRIHIELDSLTSSS